MTQYSELSDVDSFMQWLEPRNSDEPEFLQAVHGVVVNVIDLAQADRSYAQARVLQRLTEPDRAISFRVVWEDDDGRVRINRGYRVQHSNAIGPYKGGIRFASSVSQSVLKFLAFEQTFKNSLTGLNLGAGKGGADLDPHGLSDRELMRFCHAFMTELHRHIGPDTDVPAGDIGVGTREIGFLFGQYKRLQNEFGGALTGKALSFGGSQLRVEATGYGAIYFLCSMLENENETLVGKRVAVSGAGNVAVHAAEKAASLGARVVTLSDRGGFARFADGLTPDQTSQVRDLRAEGRRLSEVAEFLGGAYLEGSRPWVGEYDVAIPSAAENELDADDARTLIEGGCRYVIEGANMPLTPGAEARFASAGVKVAPGKASNAGGVAISGLEMEQNRLGRSWPLRRLDEELRALMRGIYERTKASGEVEGGIDYVRGADRAGFKRVADALVSFGHV